MSKPLGCCLLDHYDRYLGSPIDRRVFESDKHGRSIQILAYDGVFPGCRVFASLGLSNFSQQVGTLAEIVVPVDESWDDVPLITANALFRMIDLQLRVGIGVRLEGIGKIAPTFVSRCRKDAIYFTEPYGFPVGFADVPCTPAIVHIRLGMFLERAEAGLLDRLGPKAFEELMEDRQLDPYRLSRQGIDLNE